MIIDCYKVYVGIQIITITDCWAQFCSGFKMALEVLSKVKREDFMVVIGLDFYGKPLLPY